MALSLVAMAIDAASPSSSFSPTPYFSPSRPLLPLLLPLSPRLPPFPPPPPLRLASPIRCSRLGGVQSEEERAYSQLAPTNVAPFGARVDAPEDGSFQRSQVEDHGVLSDTLDPDFRAILANVAWMQKQSEELSAQMEEMQSLLRDTVRSLNVKGQETRIQTLKLKKLAKQHEINELRRIDDLRKKVLHARIEEDKGLQGGSGAFPVQGEMPPLDPFAAASNVSYSPLDSSATVISGLINGVVPGNDFLEEVWKGDPSAHEGIPAISKDLVMATGKPIQEMLESPSSLVDGFIFSHTVDASLDRQSEALETESECSVPDDKAGTDGTEEFGDPETLECVMVHPGALSCTKTRVKADQNRKSAVISMETTVRCAGDACNLTGLDENDYVALAVQTLADRAQQLKTSRLESARDADPLALERHKILVETLAHGKIVGSRPMEPPSKFGHESFIVELRNPKSGQKINAMFKPRVHGNDKGWHRAPIEWVAYELNLMLGMDYVPPVAYRTGGVNVHYKHYEDGAFIYYVPQAQTLKGVPAANWGVSVACLLSDTRILDVLLNNSDRHHGHFLFGEHWARGMKTPVLIDHAAGFRKEAVVKMDHENAFQTGPVRSVSAKTYLRLRFLEKQSVVDKFKHFLSKEEVGQLIKRRDMVLEYLDRLVQERGYHRTVIET